jgi:DNA-binding NarL/FixJ family response regulator
MADPASRPDPQYDAAGAGPLERTARTLEQTARIFRTIAQDQERLNPDLTERLRRQAREVEEWARQLRPGGAVAAPVGVATGHPHGGTAPGATAPARRRVLVADDHELALEALLSVLAREPDLEVVGQARDGRQAVSEAQRLRPDVVLMDVRMPDLDGLQATRAIIQARPQTKVVVLTSHDSREFVMEALRAGATGYLPKGATRQDLLATVRDVLDGAVRVQPDLAAQLLAEDAHGNPPPVAPDAQRLTEREREVLRLVARGQTNEEISHTLHLTLNTVKTHVAHVLRKLGAADRAEAAVRAAAQGLLAER